MWIDAEKNLMNNKLSKTLIKHCNTSFLTLKGFINRLQNFWKLHIFWNLLHKPWHNNIKKIINIFELFFEILNEYLKNITPKVIPKVSGAACVIPFTPSKQIKMDESSGWCSINNCFEIELKNQNLVTN
jgi:hypothetical protein